MMTKEEAVRELVEWHYKVDPNMTEVIRFLSPNEESADEPISLLDVSPYTLPSGNVMTFLFGPYGDFPYQMRTATITPEEMEQVRRQEIPLPPGWNLENSVVYPAADYKGQEGRRWRRSREVARSMSAPYSRHKPLSIYRKRLKVS